MGVRGLIGRALHPGVSLAHDPDHITPADAVVALGIVASRFSPIGATVLHAKLGNLDLPAFKIVVQEATGLVFGQHGWTINGTKRRTSSEVAQAFVDQVYTEFLSSPCARCGGHGWRGRKLDTVRHSLDTCPECSGAGTVARQTKSGRVVKQACRTCIGKRLVVISEAIKAGKLRVCASCDGTGRVRPSAGVRADALRCARSNIYRVWNERFTAVLRELRKIEKVALWTAEDYLS